MFADVNIFLYARRIESPRHDEYLGWLEERLVDNEPFGVSNLVLSGFLRVVTNHRVYREPTPLHGALEFCEMIVSAPAVVPIHPGKRHWQIFAGLCQRTHARANLVPDAYLAALAIESGATFCTTDRGFSRFPGLAWRHPLDP